ncbi:hypothetical protein [Rivularia sp. UHCC 0363]|nr:hypothetical protein [Rivularia sp. UHCC 0363]MEA5598501.1 hypothetical protein [Rivularia sp. UHCC 0363]
MGGVNICNHSVVLVGIVCAIAIAILSVVVKLRQIQPRNIT